MAVETATKQRPVIAPEAPQPEDMLIAVYGTLRRGQALHEAYIQPYPHEYLGIAKLPNFRLFHLRQEGYPIACPSADKFDVLTVDVFRVPNQAFKSIDRIEVGAGYLTVPVSTPYGEALMYTRYPNDIQVYSGDWVKYMEENNK